MVSILDPESSNLSSNLRGAWIIIYLFFCGLEHVTCTQMDPASGPPCWTHNYRLHEQNDQYPQTLPGIDIVFAQW